MIRTPALLRNRPRLAAGSAAAVLLVALSGCNGFSGASGSGTASVLATGGATATAPSPTAEAPTSAAPVPMPAPTSAAPAPTSGSPAPASGSPAPAAAATAQLVISVTDQPGSEVKTYLLNCDGATPLAGSTVADPASACAAVESEGTALFIVSPPANQKCPAQTGGPAVATVTGTFRGTTISAAYSQSDGCKIGQWNALAPLLGSRAGL